MFPEVRNFGTNVKWTSCWNEPPQYKVNNAFLTEATHARPQHNVIYWDGQCSNSSAWSHGSKDQLQWTRKFNKEKLCTLCTILSANKRVLEINSGHWLTLVCSCSAKNCIASPWVFSRAGAESSQNTKGAPWSLESALTKCEGEWPRLLLHLHLQISIWLWLQYSPCRPGVFSLGAHKRCTFLPAMPSLQYGT